MKKVSNKKGLPKGFDLDYKEPTTLYKYVMEAGKIVPARVSKFSNRDQRQMCQELKRARNLALLPIGTRPYDNFRNPEPISPVPFEY